MGRVDEVDEADRRRWEDLAQQGNLDGMFNLGLALRYSDPAEAQRWWRIAAESGHVLSMYTLGVHEYPSALFNLGLLFVHTDRERTRTLWREAARLGHSKAKRALVALRWMPWKRWRYSPRSR